MSRAQAVVNGKTIDVDIIEDEQKERPLIANPRVQDTAIFISGMGLAVYKGVKELLGYIPNPTGARLKRALPWVAISGLSFFLAPSFGRKGKAVARVAGAGCAAKAIYEYLKKETTVKETK